MGYRRTRLRSGLGDAPCMATGSQGPLQPGQVWCDTGTMIPPVTNQTLLDQLNLLIAGMPTAATPTAAAPGTLLGLSTTTWLLIGGVVAFASLLGGRR